MTKLSTDCRSTISSYQGSLCCWFETKAMVQWAKLLLAKKRGTGSIPVLDKYVFLFGCQEVPRNELDATSTMKWLSSVRNPCYAILVLPYLYVPSLGIKYQSKFLQWRHFFVLKMVQKRNYLFLVFEADSFFQLTGSEISFGNSERDFLFLERKRHSLVFFFLSFKKSL